MTTSKLTFRWFKGNDTSQWVRLNALLLACMVAMRVVFFFEVSLRVGLETKYLFTILSGTLFDLLLVCRVCIYGLILFLLVHHFFPKTARGIYTGLIMVYVVVVALLSEYYCNLTMPLDHVILVYTSEELKTTAFSSASLSLAQVLWFLLNVGVSVLLVWLWSRKVRQGSALSSRIVLAACLLTVLFVRYPRMIRKESLYRSHYEFCLAVNQPSYSYIKITDFIKETKQHAIAESEDDKVVKNAVEAYHAVHPEFDYDTPGYPLYRKANDPDVLGPLFNATSDGLPPNLVFIIVEGLGRRLTGVTTPKLSFTPFLDSLASKALFWPNCLSTSERTFGVLPSVFASVPHGRYGFSTNLAPMPRHHSLLLDLEQNGYTSSFYYGGDMSFDRYDFFMKTNHVDYLFMPQMVVEDSTQYNLLAEYNRWGLDDDQLFKCAIARRQADTASHRPFIDIYQTLSTHEPFVVDDVELYEEQVRRMVERTPELTENERNNVMRNLNIYACYLYTDQSIKDLLAYYAELPEFQNTIFVITGDHRMALVPTGIPLRKYNVPLVIYSPLLRQPKTMNAVVSHLDITPSFNAYLSANYNYSISDHCHWIGTSFDTTAKFQNNRKLAFMLNNRDVVDYLSGMEFLTSGRAITLDPFLIGKTCNDEQRQQTLVSELEDFNLLSRFVVQNDVLLPRNARSILYHSHFDFENNTLQIYDKFLVKGQGYLKIGNKVKHFEIGSPTIVRPGFENVSMEVSFDVKSDAAMELPLLTVTLGDYWQKYPLVSATEEPLNTGRWEHFHTRLIVNTMDLKKAETLRILLWNNAEVEYYLDNVIVTIEGVKDDDQNLK